MSNVNLFKPRVSGPRVRPITGSGRCGMPGRITISISVATGHFVESRPQAYGLSYLEANDKYRFSFCGTRFSGSNTTRL